MLVIVNFFVVVSIFSAQFMIFCLKAIIKKTPSELPYDAKCVLEEKEMKTAREPSPLPAEAPRHSRDIVNQESQSSPEPSDRGEALRPGIVLVPIKTEEQKHCEERYRLVLEAGKGKRRKDYSFEDSVSYGEDEDTLFGVQSLATDATTSMVPPRSVNGYSTSNGPPLK